MCQTHRRMFIQLATQLIKRRQERYPDSSFYFFNLQLTTRCCNTFNELFLEDQIQYDHRDTCKQRCCHQLRIIVGVLSLHFASAADRGITSLLQIRGHIRSLYANTAVKIPSATIEERVRGAMMNRKV